MNVRQLVATMAAVTSVVGVAADADAVTPRSIVLLEGLDKLDTPTGLAVDKSGALIIGQTGYPFSDPSSSIVRVPLVGPQRLQSIPRADRPFPVDVAVNPVNGRLWITAGVQVMRQRVDGSFATVIDMGAYQDGDPDPVALRLFPPQIGEEEPVVDPTVSSPAGMAFRANGELLVADKYNNDLVLVSPSGTARTVARFDVELLPFPPVLQFFGLSIELEEPLMVDTAAAPVTVMIGNDGFVYVGEQKGYPYPEDTSHVWRIDPAVLAPGAAAAWCSVDEPDPRCKVYSTGFTGIVDIAAAPPSQRGHIYVLEHEDPLYLPMIHGQGGVPLAGRLIKASGRHQVQIETHQISQPQNIVVMGGGAIYLTDWGPGGFDGRLMKIRE
jgi:hypothetical protein